jgi:hypothetical protein
VTTFSAYWTAYASEAEAEGDQKPEWSEASLAKGIVRAALVGLARLLSRDSAHVGTLVEHASGVIVEGGHQAYQGYRFIVCGVEDVSKTSLSTVARDIVEMSREAFCLCVLPSVKIALWSLLSEKWPGRTASVIPLFPADVDALASGKIALLDLIQFKFYRRLVLDKPDPGTEFDARLFAEFVAGRSGASAGVEDFQTVLRVTADDGRNWVDHPLVGRVRGALEGGRGCLLVGPSSSGKSVLAFQVGKSFLLGGRSVGYLNLGLVESNAASLFGLVSSQPKENGLSLLIVDDLQSNPAVARYILALSSAGRRASINSPAPVLAISWVDFSANAVAWFDDCLPIAVRSHQIRSRLAGHYRGSLTQEDIETLLSSCGDDVFLLRLSLDHSTQRNRCVGPHELAEIVWSARTKGSGVDDSEARRIGLVAASLGRFDIAVSPGCLGHEAHSSVGALQSLIRAGLLRRHQANLSLGHRSLSALLADWLDETGGWAELDRLGGPRAAGTVVLNYLRSLGSSLAVDSLRALHARAGFKDRPKLNRRAAALVELWDAFNAVLERIEHQQARDATWGADVSSATFAVMAFAEVGKVDLARESVAFLRSHWCDRSGKLDVTCDGLSTISDFVRIGLAMQEEDATNAAVQPADWIPAAKVDIERFHKTWVSGLILCTEAAVQDPTVSLHDLAGLVEHEQLESGAFYPERVPWCTARVLLGLAACGRTVDTSPAVAKAVKWLLRDRAEGGACSGGLWQSGTGRWNSTLETTGMVLLALGVGGHDCSDERLEGARTYLLSQKNRWTAPGKELDGALVIQALLETGVAWEDVAAESQALSRWAKGEAFWQGVARTAKESLDQSCRVAQIASHLVNIGWTAIRTDLQAFLDALATPELGRPVADISRAQGGGDVTMAVKQDPSDSDEVGLELDALRRIDMISLRDCSVVGEYRRYDERVRNTLRDWRNRIEGPLKVATRSRENFLIWAAPGSGKSFFIQEIAASLSDRVSYFELNLARLSEEEFSKRLSTVRACTKPTLCLLDEIDARREEVWPYEKCFSDMDLNLEGVRPVVFVLIGSSSSGMQAMLQGMLSRSKGKDLVDRIPISNRFEIPGLTLEDRVVVVASQVASAARARGQVVREIERLALFYALKNAELRTPRQLRDLAFGAIERMNGGDDRLKYDDLFARGDNRDKLFWVSNQEAAAEMSNTFVHIDD